MKGSGASSTAAKPIASSAAPAWPSAERFRLDGASIRLDPRIHAVRGDIADIGLADRVFAPHYARPQPCRCAVQSALIHLRPDATSRAVSQLLMGEEFAVVDVAGGWAWGYSRHDGYVGYVREDALGPVEESTHFVSATAALVFAAPDIKAPVVAHWPIGAAFAGEPRDAFIASAAGFVHTRHVRGIADPESDPVAVAERMIGTPYLWGGRGDGGIDCSGLVQLALGLCAVAAPRDSDLQRAALGRALDDDAALRRGDLVFLPGHVGLMVDAERMIHANAFWMAVTVEPLADVLTRQEPDAPVWRRRIGA